MNNLRIGMIGLDTSHVSIFTKLLHDATHPYHVTGGRVVAAYPGGSPDFPLSFNRVEGYTGELREQYGVRIADSLEEVAEECDAIMLESADGRVHLEQFRAIAKYGKPVFIDKPLALTTSEAKEIALIADVNGVAIMSSSSLRYAEALSAELGREAAASISGAEAFGPLHIQATQSHYFWYGIHAAEMLYAILGPGCEEVSVESTVEYELIKGRWRDGRIGTLRGNLNGNDEFGAHIHRLDETVYVQVGSAPKPFYASLLEQVIPFLQTRKPAVEISETVEIIRFLEAAEESRASGLSVKL
ncbi:Gfo/Idh/MocA family protein [Paenibacillus sp. PAMC21692]|uniref:Gfo/Idh/MocA family protein n=1 Tax=Paenibacillus sp. PAMC21692 TaxID=2762320 RepID=UPI00164D7625|nr:Gfo/Idh/MocA family oxidoreductase [Paenibacillus sp. PAMC21692]QNK56682.1 Gfo/Idh/MocA family oxidoreductase [Paenibacillus sp. PAMC21692]